MNEPGRTQSYLGVESTGDKRTRWLIDDYFGLTGVQEAVTKEAS
jgi:hypothetical protein